MIVTASGGTEPRLQELQTSALPSLKLVMTTQRRISEFGWTRDLADHRDWLYHLQERITPVGKLAPVGDLTNQMPPIYDQSQLGSCTGNGIARALEYRQMQQFEGVVTPSRLFIYYEERVIEGTVSQDAGAMIRDGIKVVASKGAPPETDWPYDISKFADQPPSKAYQDALKHTAKKYQRVIPGGGVMRSAIASGLPIVFGFSVPASFEDGSWDPATEALPLPGPNEGFIGGHCVVVVGYDWTRTRFSVPVFKCANSWGADWGENGYFYMDYRWFTPSRGLADDLWVISQVS